MKRKIVSLLMAVLILLSGLGPLPAISVAAASGSSNADMDALTALGIDSSVAPDGYDPNSLDNPYGRNVIQVAPVYELYKIGLTNKVAYDATHTTTTTPQIGNDRAEHTKTTTGNELRATIYGHKAWGTDKAEDILKTSNAVTKVIAQDGESSATGSYTMFSTETITQGHLDDLENTSLQAEGHLSEALTASTRFGDNFDFALAKVAAGNFDGNEEGLKAQTVMVYAGAYSAAGGLYLRFGDAEGTAPSYGDAKVLLATSKKLGNPNLEYEGKKVENFAENPYQLQNYLQVATGDWNNDGVDDVAVYIPEPGNSRIVIYTLQKVPEDGNEAFKNPNKWQVTWTYPLKEGDVVSNMVSFTSADVNQDGIDDLAATWGYYFGPEQNKGSKAVVMFGAKGIGMLQKSQQFDLTYGTSNIVRASFAFGDMAGANAKTLVLAGQSDADLQAGNTQSRYVALYDWNGTAFQTNIYQNFDLFAKDEKDEYVWGAMSTTVREGAAEDKFFSLPLSVANTAMLAQGLGKGGDLLYVDSLLVEYTEEGLQLKDAWDNSPAMQESVGTPKEYVEQGAIAGDLTGITGSGTLMTMVQTLAVGDNTTGSYTVKGTYLQPVYELEAYYLNWLFKIVGFKSYRWKLVREVMKEVDEKVNVHYYALHELGKNHLVAVDWAAMTKLNEAPSTPYFWRTQEDFSAAICLANTDKDSSYMSYGGKHYYTYTDPEVLAVLASPPYFADLLDRDDLSGNYAESTTSYSRTKGSGTGSTSAVTLTVGAYVAFEQDITVFGVTVASVEAEATVTAGFTWETETTSTLEQTIGYTAAAGEDMVAFYSIPMEIYEYTSFVPDGNGNYDEVLTTVNIPHEAAIRLLSLEEYEFIAKDYRVLPQIANNVLTHEVGNPASYPTSTAGYNVIAEYEGDPAAVGFSSTGGGSAISQEIAMSTETADAFEVTGGLETKAGAGAGGFKVGIVAGVEGGAGTVTISTSGSSFSGEMQNMPIEAQPFGYGLNWKIFCYQYNNKGSKFPVVSYLVSDIQNPPPLPVDFEQNMADTTDESITLDWTYKGNIAGFRIYRYYEFPEGSGSYEVAFVPFTAGEQDEDTKDWHFSYTDVGLSPYTEYSYQIKAVRGANPKESIYSEPLICRTKTLVGYPQITLSGLTYGALPIYPDGVGKVTVAVADAAKYSVLNYQWQKLTGGSWEAIPGKTGTEFSITNAGAADDGLYRCRVNAIYYDAGAAQNYYISAYSPSFPTAYRKRTPKGELSAKPGQVAGAKLTLDAGVEIHSGHEKHSAAPSGRIVFTITGTDYSYSETVSLAQQEEEKIIDGVSQLWSSAALSPLVLPKGVYTVNAYYTGSKIFQDYDFEEQLVIIGDAEGHRVRLASEEGSETSVTSFIYGQKIWPRLEEISKDGDKVKLTVLTEGVSHKVQGGNIDPKTEKGLVPGNTTPDIGSYTLEAYQDGDLKAVQNFTVTKKPITVGMENNQVYFGEVSGKPPLTICSDLLPSELEALNLSFMAFNTAENLVESFGNDTEPGTYRLIACPSATTPSVLYQNYSVTYTPGTYIVQGVTYDFEVKALDYGEGVSARPVGTAAISNTTGLATVYPAGTDVVLFATPQPGYQVDKWLVKFGENAPVSSGSSNTLTIRTQAQKADVTVSFKPAQIKLSTSVSPQASGTITCSDENFSSGAFVGYGADFLFTATPNPGYHFKEWRVVEGGRTSYPAGTPNEDGSNTLTIQAGRDNITVYGDFERDLYQLFLEGAIGATYKASDGIGGFVNRAVASGDFIPGDSEVTVKPKAGYSAAEGEFFVLNEETTEKYEALDFTLTRDSLVSLNTRRNSYTVTVTAENGSVTTTVDGLLADADGLEAVLGGSTLRFTAKAERGFVFSKWLVNGVEAGTPLMPTLTIRELEDHIEVNAEFAANDAYQVTATAQPNERGSMGYRLYDIYGDLVEEDDFGTDPLEVFKGESLTFLAKVVPGNMVEQWQINNDYDYTSAKTYTIEGITTNLNVTAHLKAASSYLVYFEAPGDEQEEPARGSLTVTADGVGITSGSLQFGGSSLCFAATPDEGYMVDYWTVTPSSNPADESITRFQTPEGTDYNAPLLAIDPLREHLVVRVYFITESMVQVTLPSEADLDNSGRAWFTYATPLNPDDREVPVGQSISLRSGGTIVFRVQAEAGYATSAAHLQEALASKVSDGAIINVSSVATAGEPDEYEVRVSNIIDDLDLTDAEFFYPVFNVTAEAATNGSVAVSPEVAQEDELVTITVRPKSGYRLSTLTLDSDAEVELKEAVVASLLTYTFDMPAADVTVQATFSKIPEPPAPTPGPGGDPGTPAQRPYITTPDTASGGGNTHNVQATAGLIPAIVSTKANKASSFVLDISGELDDEDDLGLLTVTVPTNIAGYLNGLDVVIQTPYGNLGLPKDLMSALAQSGEPLQLSIEPTDGSALQDQLGDDELLGKPLEINTELEGDILVTLPCSVALPADAEAREAFLAGLYVLAVHGDEDSERLTGLVFDIDEKTNTLRGISFITTRFSTFALVGKQQGQEGPEDQDELELVTFIDGNSYTVNGVTKPFDNFTAYRAGDGTTVMAVRLLEELGAKIGYTKVDDIGTVTVVLGDITATLREQSPVMTVVDGNGERRVEMQTTFANLGGRTYLPTRAVAENLGFLVHWQQADDSITIKKP